MIIRQPSVDDAGRFAAYYSRNASHLQPWEPFHSEEFYTLESWRQRLALREREMAEERALFFVALSDEETEIIATCSLTGILRGYFQAAYLGYSIAEKHQGKGLMYLLCCQVIDHAFGTMALHRLMANYMPGNKRSEALLHRLGFEREGYAQSYLKINGVWEDHIMTALINPLAD